MANVPEVFVRNPDFSSRRRDFYSKGFAYIAVGLVSIIVGVSTVTGIVYLTTRNCDWINVHLIPHTHDDVGWLKTPEEYYDFSVRFILTHVVNELEKNPDRKFVYVETYFFMKWWNQQTEETREKVRKLIRAGQLEMIGGGVTMSDEAVVHYQSFIDQSTWGFRLLNDTFGRDVDLNVAWQIDTFGHSKNFASLLSQMGFEALFFARIDLDDRRYRQHNKIMEFVWNANQNLGLSGKIFTSIFYDHYSSPSGFDFEWEPVEYGIKTRKFVKYARYHADTLRTNNILVPMGDDFRFLNAENYFTKIDELIKTFQMNQEYKLNVFYSTPSQYLEALRESRTNWPRFTGDFFPYGSQKHTYWTGYYTSRPSLKYFERISNNFLQIVKQLLVFSNFGCEFFDELNVMREAMGILQHHDAVTGTAKQYVTDHYVSLLSNGHKSCEEPVNLALRKLMLAEDGTKRLAYKSCLLLNISECTISSESENFVVTVYNPLNRVVDHYVRFPVQNLEYMVRSKHHEYMDVQYLNVPQTILNIPGRSSRTYRELIFKARNLPPMGYKSFYVSAMTDFAQQRKRKRNRKNRRKRKTAAVEVGFHESGIISSVSINGKCLSLQQSIRYYIGSHHWTGAYIFRPEQSHTEEMGPVSTRVLNDGDIVLEYEQVFSQWASQIVRIYKEEEYVEIEWLVGPIPVGDYRGKEVVLVYSSGINNGDVFYTDTNGQRVEKRIRDYREWNEMLTEPIAGNYYPVTTQIHIKDDSTQLYVVTDRAQGGSSLVNGRIELMVHRRLCYDDGKGVNEPLSEEAFGYGLISRGKHWITFGDTNDPSFPQRVKLLADEKQFSPWLFFAGSNEVPFEEWSQYRNEFTGLSDLTELNLRILTLEPWTATTQLLRLENIFDAFSMSHLSGKATVSLKYLFQNYIVTAARETTLGANKWLSETRRYAWCSREYHCVADEDVLEGNMTVTIEPEHIRTFVIKMEPNGEWP